MLKQNLALLPRLLHLWHTPQHRQLPNRRTHNKLPHFLNHPGDCLRRRERLFHPHLLNNRLSILQPAVVPIPRIRPRRDLQIPVHIPMHKLDRPEPHIHHHQNAHERDPQRRPPRIQHRPRAHHVGYIERHQAEYHGDRAGQEDGAPLARRAVDGDESGHEHDRQDGRVERECVEEEEHLRDGQVRRDRHSLPALVDAADGAHAREVCDVGDQRRYHADQADAVDVHLLFVHGLIRRCEVRHLVHISGYRVMSYYGF